MTVRTEVVAGSFYPSNSAQLRSSLTEMINHADPPRIKGRLRALIAPHAGHVYCGGVAASAFKLLSFLDQSKRWRVLHIGPSHQYPVSGVAVSTADKWRTPLGEVSTSVPFNLSHCSNCKLNEAPHRQEHSLEVQLPFIQMTLKDFTVTPMLVGDVDPVTLAGSLRQALADDVLIIASTDLSHYRPQNLAHEIDMASNDAISRLDTVWFAKHGDACGKQAVLALMELSRMLDWQPHMLDYKTSGDVSGDRSQVVGYCAFAFTG